MSPDPLPQQSRAEQSRERVPPEFEFIIYIITFPRRETGRDNVELNQSGRRERGRLLINKIGCIRNKIY